MNHLVFIGHAQVDKFSHKDKFKQVSDQSFKKEIILDCLKQILSKL